MTVAHLLGNGPTLLAPNALLWHSKLQGEDTGEAHIMDRVGCSSLDCNEQVVPECM